MKVGVSLCFSRKSLLKKGGELRSYRVGIWKFFMWSLSFKIEKWLFAVHGGSSRGETRLKWPISQSARGIRWCVAKEVAVGEVGASILDVEVSDVLSGKDKARTSCCRLLRILIARRLNFIGF